MKFLVSKKLSKKSPIFPPVMGLVLFFFIGLLFNMAYINSKVSLTPQSAVENILGNEEAFIEPLLPEELLSIVHVELLFFMFVVPLSFFIYYRLSQTSRVTWELVTTFVLTQAALIFLAFSQVVGIWFVYLFLGTFMAVHILLAYIIIRILLILVRNG